MRTDVAQTVAEILQVRQLTKTYGGVRAVDNASFNVVRGRITGLIGPNGAGKSTALGIIAGSFKPTSGSVLLDGTEIAGTPSYKLARQGIARTFQISSEFAGMTVLENLLAAPQGQKGETLWGAIRGRGYWRTEEDSLIQRAAELMIRFDMFAMANEVAGTLSGGQRRLLEIMRSLMSQPKLLLLDEPMAGVHPTLGRRIEDYLAELQDEGLTMLLVEHEMAVVERLCDAVIVMARGEVIAEGTMADVSADRRVLDAYLNG
jgi:ABC-type branched-subunit amino acid transport system ATPase component